MRQTYKGIEIILVDDGSTDRTVEVISSFVRNAENIRIIRKRKNEGVSAARLTGANNASGEYVSFVDADDWVENDFIERMLSDISGGDIVAAGIFKEWYSPEPGNENEYNKFSAGVYESDLDRSELYKKMLCYGYPYEFGILPYMCNKVYRRNLIIPLLDRLDKRIFDGEDVAVIFEYLLRSKKIVISDTCKYHYCIRKGSAAFSDTSDSFANAAYLYLYLRDTFKKYDETENLLPQVDDYFRFMIWKKDPAAYLLVNKNEFLFPYSKVPTGSEIIIYGAGKMGVAYVHQVYESNNYSIVAWADRNPSEYKKGDLFFKQISPDKISEHRFDYVVIALYDKVIRETVRNNLLEMGIHSSKIVEPEQKTEVKR